MGHIAETVEDFYLGMCPHYHLFFESWDGEVARQGAALDRIISQELRLTRKRILDAACGIGTQAVGLALLGHEVVGTDISASALARADREAFRLGARLSTKVADMRALSQEIEDRFAVITVLDNSLAHFLSQQELVTVARELAATLEASGLLLASIRDYALALEERPKLTSTRVIDGAEGRRIVFQVWDWDSDDIYDMTQYLLRHEGEAVDIKTFTMRLRAVTKEAVHAALEEAGFTNICWLDPNESGFYQPLVLARY